MKHLGLNRIGRFCLQCIISAFAVLITTFLLKHGITIEQPVFLNAIIVALVLGLLNNLIKPLLVTLTIPFTIFTFGLFLLVINAVIIYMVDYIVAGFCVKSFGYAVLFSLFVSLFTAILDSLSRRFNGSERDSDNDDHNDEYVDYEEVSSRQYEDVDNNH